MSTELARERLEGVRAVVWELRQAVGGLRGSNRMWTAESARLVGEIEQCCQRLSDLASANGDAHDGA